MNFSAYLIGRNLQEDLPSSKKASDCIFAAKRLDGQSLGGYEIVHSTFANISFLTAKISKCRFKDCVFVGCYFRRTELENVEFEACKFLSCDFANVSISGCDFRHSRFAGCFISFAKLSLSLPQEPNLRQEICKNLAIEAAKSGFQREARKYRMAEIRAHEKDLKSAMLGTSDWYKKHYDTLGRIGAGFRLFGSKINGYVWGYGEKASKLLVNFALLAFVVFPLLFYLFRGGLRRVDQTEITFSDYILLSLQNTLRPSILNQTIQVVSGGARWIALLESFLGILLAGLLVSYLFRWIIRR